MKKVYKVKKKAKLTGVCAGIAEAFNIDPTVVRILTVLLCHFNGVGFILYLILALLLPNK